MEHKESSVDIYAFPDSRPTYNFITFGKEVQTLTVTGLYGCTAVIVISRTGAWMGHFYETPFFRLNMPDDPNFINFVVEAMDTGVPRFQPGQQYINQYAIGELRNHYDKGDLGHIFDDEHDPQVMIVTPRYREFDMTPMPGSTLNMGALLVNMSIRPCG